MKELLTSGRVIDLALFVIGLELAALLLLHRRGQSAPSMGRHPLRPVDLMGQILAGAFLLLALRLTLGGADYRLILLALTASFPAHLFDVTRRLRQARLT